MKNIFSIFAIAVTIGLFSFEVNAQEKGAGNRVGGIRIGYHSSQFYEDGNSYGDPIQSIYIGLYRDNKIIPMLHFGSGLEYYKNGGKIDDANMRELYYLSVPLDLKFKIGPVFALAGFSPSFKVADRITIDGNKEKPTDAQKAEWFDIPFFLGAGVKIWVLSIEARYLWGMMEVTDGYKSQSFQLGVGFSF